MLNGAAYVQDIHYDAKGQREAIWYGNGTKTGYTYDTQTFRLRRLLTVNVDVASANYNQVLQNLYYYYDPVGNITMIKNALDEPVYYNNNVMQPHQKFTYDALYRLTIAEGRELIQAAGHTPEDTWVDAIAPSAVGGNACRNYTQTYTYDEVGNITALQHSAGTGSYTRTYTYTNNSNRLSATQTGSNPAYNYTHDARGNMIEMPHLSVMGWNNQNQLSHITRGTTEAYYQYSNGQRIRKYVDNGSEKEERIYLGNYEVYRKYDSSSNLIVERETIHVSDDTGRIAMLEVRTRGNASDDNSTAQTLIRYIYSNHLQSASLELDDTADIISYEEYHPYGTTSYQAKSATINATAKRYRYTGKERDEESGLYYHGARYYVPWLCRWAASDPLESMYAGWSGYNYGFDNPVKWNDSTGMEPEDPKDEKKDAQKAESNKDNSKSKKNSLQISLSETEENVFVYMQYGTLYAALELDLSDITRKDYINEVKKLVEKTLENSIKRYDLKVEYRELTPPMMRSILNAIRPLESERGKVGARTNAGKTNEVFNRLAIGFKHSATTLEILNIAFSSYNIASAKNPKDQAVKESFSWVGAMYGGKLGSEFGLGIGTEFGGVAGGLIGSFVLGITGSIVGGIYGKKAAEELLKPDNIFNLPTYSKDLNEAQFYTELHKYGIYNPDEVFQ